MRLRLIRIEDFFFVKVRFKILRDIFVFVRRNDQTMKGRKKIVFKQNLYNSITSLTLTLSISDCSFIFYRLRSVGDVLHESSIGSRSGEFGGDTLF
jgi:hypothetical protein